VHFHRLPARRATVTAAEPAFGVSPRRAAGSRPATATTPPGPLAASPSSPPPPPPPPSSSAPSRSPCSPCWWPLRERGHGDPAVGVARTAAAGGPRVPVTRLRHVGAAAARWPPSPLPAAGASPTALLPCRVTRATPGTRLTVHDRPPAFGPGVTVTSTSPARSRAQRDVVGLGEHQRPRARAGQSGRAGRAASRCPTSA